MRWLLGVRFDVQIPWRRTISALACLMLASAAFGQTRPLNDSGQITCYNATTSTGTVSAGTPDPETAGFNEQDCTRGRSAADAVGALRKIGASSVPGRDYSKIANDGSDLPASAVLGTGAGAWGCTRDNVTGLIWEIKTDDNGLRNVGHRYTWYDTNTAINGGNAGTLGTSTTCNSTLSNCNTTAFRNSVNALAGASRLCGQTDWRLPTASELQSLLHDGAFTPAIDGVYFPNTISNSYWSGVNSASNAGLAAWCVFFDDGFVDFNNKSGVSGVRLVRGGQ